MRIYDNKWYKVRGGKYTQIIYNKDDEYIRSCYCKECSKCFFNDYKRQEMLDLGLIYENSYSNVHLFNKTKCDNYIRPICYCGIPCEINTSKYGDYYWKCSMISNSWIDEYFNKGKYYLNINNGCDFFILDKDFKNNIIISNTKPIIYKNE